MSLLDQDEIARSPRAGRLSGDARCASAPSLRLHVMMRSSTYHDSIALHGSSTQRLLPLYQWLLSMARC